VQVRRRRRFLFAVAALHAVGLVGAGVLFDGVAVAASAAPERGAPAPPSAPPAQALAPAAGPPETTPAAGEHLVVVVPPHEVPPSTTPASTAPEGPGGPGGPPPPGQLNPFPSPESLPRTGLSVGSVLLLAFGLIVVGRQLDRLSRERLRRAGAVPPS
jgi:hypothetical protein